MSKTVSALSSMEYAIGMCATQDKEASTQLAEVANNCTVTDREALAEVMTQENMENAKAVAERLAKLRK